MPRLSFSPSFWRTFLLISVVVMGALPILLYPMGRDQAMYANIGRSILAGGTPFVEMWDIKPPPIYYLYATALALFGDSTASIRLLDLLLVPLGMAGMAWLGQRAGLGIWGALFYGVFMLNETFASLSQNDSLVTVPTIAMVCAAWWASERPRNSHVALVASVGAGMLGGLLLWFKPQQAFIVGAIVLHHVWARRTFPLKEALAFVVGGLISAGAWLLLSLVTGMWSEMLIVAEGTAAYNAQNATWETFFASMSNYLRFRWQQWGVMLLAVLAWLPLRVGGRAPTPTPVMRLAGLWLAGALAFAVSQRLGFDTHWIPLVPPLALIAGDSLRRFYLLLPQNTLGLIGRGATLAGVLSVLFVTTWSPALPYVAGQIDRVAYYRHFQANDLKAWESLQVVAYLQARVARGDTLYVWGFRPEVAFMGGWRPATRFQAQFPLVADWYPDVWRTENVQTLWAAMPPYALVLEDDFMRWVTNRDADSHTLLQDYEDLNNWLMANYEREAEIGDFLLWRRK